MDRTPILILAAVACYAHFSPDAGLNLEQQWANLRAQAEARYQQRRFLEAEKAWEAALSAARRFGSKDPRLALSLGSLGVIALEQGRLSEAERLITEAIQIYRVCAKSCLVALGITLRNLGNVYQQQGRFNDAEQTLRRALATGKTVSAVDEQRCLTLAALGSLNLHRNELGSAESWYRRAIASPCIVEARAQPKAEVYFGLGAVLMRARRFVEAERAFQSSMQLLTNSLGPDHPDLAAVHTKLASLASERADYSSAEQHLSRARELLSNVSGDEPVDLGIVLHDLGLLRSEQGRFAEAEGLLVEGLRIVRRHLGKTHPELLHVQISYAELLRKIGRKDEARHIEGEVRRTRDSVSPADRGGQSIDYRTLRQRSH